MEINYLRSDCFEVKTFNPILNTENNTYTTICLDYNHLNVYQVKLRKKSVCFINQNN